MQTPTPTRHPTQPLLRLYVRGMILETHAADDGSTHIVSRRDQQHKSLGRRLRQHLANALFRAGDLCHPRHYHGPLRIVELHVSAAPVDDLAAYVAQPYVLERLARDAADGDTHYQTLLVNE